MSLALIVGGASCVWLDCISVLKMTKPDAVMVINDMIPLWPASIDYVVSLHPEKLSHWLKERKRKQSAKTGETWSNHRLHDVVKRTTPDWAGSSGLLAVKIAMEEKFDGAILAGVPMSPVKHFTRNVDWTAAMAFRNGWNAHRQEILPFARSMSGWTRELLGGPTPEWLRKITSAEPDHEMVALLEKLNEAQVSIG